jgi:hypothetical protein
MREAFHPSQEYKAVDTKPVLNSQTKLDIEHIKSAEKFRIRNVNKTRRLPASFLKQKMIFTESMQK